MCFNKAEVAVGALLVMFLAAGTDMGSANLVRFFDAHSFGTLIPQKPKTPSLKQ